MIAENQKVKLFDEFYSWLVADGLKANKSERLHRKSIFASLMANKKMTVENFEDFLVYKKENERKVFIRRIENLECEQIFYLDSYRYISRIEIFEEQELFKITTSYFDKNEISHLISCKFEQLEEIEKLIKKRD